MTNREEAKADIIAANPVWFSKDTMAFWNTAVLWDTLTAIGNERYAFLTLDDNYDRTERRYSLRLTSPEGGITTMHFQEWDYLEDAKDCFYEVVAKELHAR